MNRYLDKKYIAEFVGTLALVLVGCGAITIGGFGDAFPLGILPIALAFGLTVTAMAYGVGAISGAHLNPAVTVAMWAGGRIRTEDIAGYIIAQCVGAIVAAGLLVVILKGRQQGWDLSAKGLGQNGWGPGYLGGYTLGAAILVEFLATLLFTLVILGSTSGRGATPFPGLVIGLTLTAVFVGGNALWQLWLFLVIPTIAGAVAGWLVKAKHLDI
jgi:aquaporin Z